MAQFPFAHTLTMTYRVQEGALEVHTRIDSLSAEPITNILPDPQNVAVKDVTLDDIFTDLERDARGLATMSLKGKSQQVDVVLGPKFKTILVLSRVGGGNRGGAGRGAPPNPDAPPPRGSVAFEPMAGISNSMNLAQKGLYKDLQVIEPGGFWEESFWVRPKGY